jgi:hypothetical protein
MADVILDFNRKSSDHIKALTSLFVKVSSQHFDRRDFWDTKDNFLKSPFLKISPPCNTSSSNKRNKSRVFDLFSIPNSFTRVASWQAMLSFLMIEGYLFSVELIWGTFNIGSKRRSEAIPPDIAIRNDHMSVPVVSATQPAMIGEIMVPIPR